MIAVRSVVRGNRLAENAIKEALESIAGMLPSAQDIDVGTPDNDVANIFGIDLQMGVEDQVHAVAERVQYFCLKNHVMEAFVPNGR